MRHRWAWMTVFLLGTTLFAQTTQRAKTRKTAGKPEAAAITAADVQALKEAIAAQQEQIEQLRQSLEQRDQAVQAARQAAQQAQATAGQAEQKAEAAAGASADKDSVDKLNSDLTDVKNTIQNKLVGPQEEQNRVAIQEGA